MKNWLKHFVWWLQSFPIGDYHTHVSVMGEAEETCLVCGDKVEKPSKDVEKDLELLQHKCEKCGQVIWDDE
jgi:uncharacterized protein with PIN domain